MASSKNKGGFIALYALGVILVAGTVLVVMFQEIMSEAVSLDGYGYGGSLLNEDKAIESAIREEVLNRVELRRFSPIATTNASVETKAKAVVAKAVFSSYTLTQTGNLASLGRNEAVFNTEFENPPTSLLGSFTGGTFAFLTSGQGRGFSTNRVVYDWIAKRTGDKGTFDLRYQTQVFYIPLTNISCVGYALRELNEGIKPLTDTTRISVDDGILGGMVNNNGLFVSANIPPISTNLTGSGTQRRLGYISYLERTKASFAWSAWSWLWTTGIDKYRKSAMSTGNYFDLGLGGTYGATSEFDVFASKIGDVRPVSAMTIVAYNPQTKTCRIRPKNLSAKRCVFIRDGLIGDSNKQIIIEGGGGNAAIVILGTGQGTLRTPVQFDGNQNGNLFILNGCLFSGKIATTTINGGLWLDPFCDALSGSGRFIVKGSFAFSATRPPLNLDVTIPSDPNNTDRNTIAGLSPLQAVVITRRIN